LYLGGGPSFSVSILGDLHEHLGEDEKPTGLLGRYDTRTREMNILASYRVASGSHVVPAPVGGNVVMGERRDDETNLFILLYDAAAGEMRPILTGARNPPGLDRRIQLIRAGDPSEKRYDVSAHPVFSPDGRKIVFNSCADGIIRPREIELPRPSGR